jgi:hypothetical protein
MNFYAVAQEICGTSAIFRFAPDELSASVDDGEQRYFSLLNNRIHWEDVAGAAYGR